MVSCYFGWIPLVFASESMLSWKSGRVPRLQPTNLSRLHLLMRLKGALVVRQIIGGPNKQTLGQILTLLQCVGIKTKIHTMNWWGEW